MTKKLLLTAVAVGALGFAGAASAQDADRFFGYRAITADLTDIDAGDVNADGVFPIAEEIAATSLSSGTLALTDNLGDGNAIPSGNNLYTIRLSNATFGTAVTSANFVGLADDGTEAPGNCTVTVSTGGAADDVQVELLVSSTGAGPCSGFNIDLPVLPDTVGDVTITANLRTESGNPIDGGLESLDAIAVVDAFQVFINGTIGAAATTAGLDTIALLADPTYTTLGGDNQLGSVWIAVDEDAHFELDAASNVTLGDVVDATVTVDGDFTAFDDAADPDLEEATLDSLDDDQAVFNPTDLATPLSAQVADSLTVTPDGDVIPASDYEVTVAYELDAQYAPQDDVTGDFERIQREGTNVLLPWMNSSATAAATGTNNIVRISNLSGEDAPVSADVLSSSNASYADGGIVALGTVPAGGELVLTAAQLAPLGDFARGDVQIIVEADSSAITVKRYAILANGSVTEFESGSVASDQNEPSVP